MKWRISLILFLLSIQFLSGQIVNDSVSYDTIPELDSLLNNRDFEEAPLSQMVNEPTERALNEADSVNLKMLRDSLITVKKEKELLRNVLVFVKKQNGKFNDSLSQELAHVVLLKDSIQTFSEELHDLRLRFLISDEALSHCNDSLQTLIVLNDSLLWAVEKLQKRNKLLQPLNKELNERIENLQATVEQQSDMLNQQIQKIKEKEQLFVEKELIYERAIQESKIDLVKLEGQLQSKNSELAGKGREIELLAESISERKNLISEKNEEIDEIRHRRQSAVYQLDTLRNYVRLIEKDLILSQERLTYSDKEIKHLQKQIFDLTNKKKNIRLVQGLAIRNFRAPLYTLSPESSENPDNYVITNENAGDYEFDFVTGATFRILDLGKDNGQYTSDIGFFLGFGGKNLFKNFYIGPNIKLFDVIHVNAGLNIAEFRLLKSGFSEGDIVTQGSSIPTVSKWQLTPYFGLTFDFSLITSIAGKL